MQRLFHQKRIQLQISSGTETAVVSKHPNGGWIPHGAFLTPSVHLGGLFSLHSPSAPSLWASSPVRAVSRLLAGRVLFLEAQRLAESHGMEVMIHTFRRRGGVGELGQVVRWHRERGAARQMSAGGGLCSRGARREELQAPGESHQSHRSPLTSGLGSWAP